MNEELLNKVIDSMIKDYQKHYDEKGICWLCYEDERCYHKYKVDALNELKENLKHPEKLNYTYSGIRSYYVRLMKKLGMNYNIHQLRATRGTYFANKNANPANLQKYMRHKDIRTTYAHYSKIHNESILDDLNKCL